MAADVHGESFSRAVERELSPPGLRLAATILPPPAGLPPRFDARLTDWARANNPFFSGPNADMLSMIPFIIITLLLYLTGREVILASKKEE